MAYKNNNLSVLCLQTFAVYTSGSDIGRRPHNLKKISHFVLKLLSNVKRVGEIFFKFLLPSQNIQTLSIHLKGSYMHKPIKYILYIDLVFLADVGDFSIPMSLAL